MTPTELETYVRQRYNSVGDSFWSSTEIQGMMYAASLEMAREAFLIERTYSTTTVAGTQAYAFPSETIAIKRVTYNGSKLQPINFREDDQLTGLNQATLSQGSPQYYFVWNETLYLRPIPDNALSLVIYSFNEPQVITTTSTLDVPSQFHTDIADFILHCMHAKEKNFAGAKYYYDLWKEKKTLMKMWSKKRRRTDAFANVQDVDSLAESFLGTT